MEDNTLVKSSFSATINAPTEKIFPLGALPYPSRNTNPPHQLTTPAAQPRRRTVGACRSMSKCWAEA